MEDIEIINLWKSYEKKLEDSILLNRKNATDITQLKVQSAIASMKPFKIFAIVIGILWVALIDIMIVRLFHIANPFFLISAGMISLLNTLAIGILLYQLILVQKVDVSRQILTTQKQLTRLRSSTIWGTRLLFLQLPGWTIFYWNSSMLTNGNIWLYTIQIIVTGSFTYFAIWLFVNIRYENRDKKWFRLIFNGKEWEPVMRSVELLRELDEYSRGA